MNTILSNVFYSYIFFQVYIIHPTFAGRITGMLLDLNPAQLLLLLSSDELLRVKVEESVELILASSNSQDLTSAALLGLYFYRVLYVI